MANNKIKKIVFVKDGSGAISQAVDMDIYKKERKSYGGLRNLKSTPQFLIGIGANSLAKYGNKKKCCGRS